MSINLTNKHNVPLALAVWLVADNYDYQAVENYVSVTSLMRPLRQLVLSARTIQGSVESDLADFASRAMGNALHDSIEKAWLHHHQKSMELLGYPKEVIDRVLINPSAELVSRTKDAIPIYLEQRAFKKVGKWTIGGKFDMVADGIVHDNKSTTAYTWLTGDKDKDYQLQGSLYRWLNPDKITEDFIRINFIFTDWSKVMAKSDPKYPQAKVLAKEVPLLSLQETQDWVEGKLAQIEQQGQEGPDLAQPTVLGEQAHQQQVRQHRKPDRQCAKAQRQLQRIGLTGHQDRGDLPGNRHPAHQDQCAQPNHVGPGIAGRKAGYRRNHVVTGGLIFWVGHC